VKRWTVLSVVAVVSVAAIWWWHFNSRKAPKPVPEEAATNIPVVNYPPQKLFHGRTQPIREIANRYVPKRRVEQPRNNEQHSYPDRNITVRPDGALQTKALPGTLSATVGLSFDGLSSWGAYPADANGAVGTTQYVEVVNDMYAVYDKTGKLLLGPVGTNSLWDTKELHGTPCQLNDDGDATVAFDKQAQTWVVQQFVTTAPFSICVAVSTSADATGTWNAYAAVFNFGSYYFADYPKLGTWPTAFPGFPKGVYLLTADIFDGGPKGNYGGPVACFMDRGAMLTGQPATQSQCYGFGPEFNPFLPADLDGNIPPFPGEAGIFMTWDPNCTQVDLIQLTPCYPNCTTVYKRPLAVPTFTPYFKIAGHGPNCTYNGTTRNGIGNCDIPEASGDGTYLDSISWNPMYRLNYRRGRHLEYLSFTHTVLAVVNGQETAAMRWYQIRDPNTRPFVVQAGTFAPDPQWRWMGSTAMDGSINQALGYSVSTSQLSGYPGPQIAVTGRAWNDPANQMENETVVLKNYSYQNSGNTRWGDYSSMQVDPVDDCTFWFTTEYVLSTGASSWGTHIVTFKFPSCQN